MKRLFICYAISGLLFVIILSGAVALNGYKTSVLDTLNKLHTVRANLAIMEGAINDMDITISEAERAIPHDLKIKTPERLIFTALDKLKARMYLAEIRVSPIVINEVKVSLPVVIRAEMKNYTALVNNVGYLEALRFPFFSIDDISISRNEELISYEIRGRLVTKVRR